MPNQLEARLDGEAFIAWAELSNLLTANRVKEHKQIPMKRRHFL